MWSVASLEKTEVNSVYSGGRVTLGLAFSAAIASSVVVVSVTVGPGRNDRRPGDKGLLTKSLAYQRDESYD